MDNLKVVKHYLTLMLVLASVDILDETADVELDNQTPLLTT